jgi:hypothetical protein
MASANKMDIQLKKCVTPEFRVSYPAVFKPKSYKDQEPKYSLVMIFDKATDLTKLRTAVRNAIVEQFGEDKTRWPTRVVNGKRELALRMPFRDGGDRPDTEGYGEDKIFVSASSKAQPGLVNARLDKIISEQEFYAGCWARAELIAFYYDTNGNKGVSFSLQNIQKIRDDKPFSGRKAAEDVFEVVNDGSDDPSAYGGVDDAGAESADIGIGI